MIKVLAITPPILGCISIGKIVEKNGERIPENNDEFTITSQTQSKNGWVKHPMDEALRVKAGHNKLRNISVRMIFDDPEQNLRVEYTLFDRQTGRPICIGNGETCQRLGSQGIEEHPCASPSLCSLSQGGLCKTYARLYVNLDEVNGRGTFIFRTTDFYSIRTLAARLAYYHAVSEGLLSCMSLQLTLRAKNSTNKYLTPLYYADLILRDGVLLHDAIVIAKEINERNKQVGLSRKF